MMYRKKKPCLDIMKDQIIQMVADGKKPVEIAAKVGATRRGIELALVRWGEYTVESTNFSKFLSDKETVIEARTSGVTRAEITERWGVNTSTVTKYLTLWGHPFDRVPEIDAEAIIDLRRGGLLLKEIAQMTGTSLSSVSRVIKRNDLVSTHKAKRQPALPVIRMPNFREGKKYVIEKEEYTFQRMLEARRPMAVFLDSYGRTTTFTDVQLVGIKEVELNEDSQRGA